MGRPPILDRTLMRKIAAKLSKKDITAVNGVVSRRASKLGVSAEAALVVLAKEHGIGASTYQRKLDAAKQAEIRDNLPSPIPAPTRNVTYGFRTQSSRSVR